MKAIRIAHTVPLSGSILLVIVKSPANGKNDAILLVASREDVLLPGYIESLEQTLSWPDNIQPGEGSEDVTLEVEEWLFNRAKIWCADVGISIEQLALAFFRFCACKDNHTALRELFSLGGIMAELNSTLDELRSVRAELLEIKRRFGIDKQEAFLEANANITLKEFAAMLHGRDRQPNLTPEELLLAKLKGFVVVYGDSDDLVEFEGAIREEGETNPLAKDSPAGVLVLSENGALLQEDSDLYAEHVKENRNVITVFYCCKEKYKQIHLEFISRHHGDDAANLYIVDATAREYKSCYKFSFIFIPSAV